MLAEFAHFGPELQLTGNSVFNVIFAGVSQLAIAILRENRYCQTTGKSHSEKTVAFAKSIQLNKICFLAL